MVWKSTAGKQRALLVVLIMSSCRAGFIDAAVILHDLAETSGISSQKAEYLMKALAQWDRVSIPAIPLHEARDGRRPLL